MQAVNGFLMAFRVGVFGMAVAVAMGFSGFNLGDFDARGGATEIVPTDILAPGIG